MLSDRKHAPLLQNKGTYIDINGLMARLLNQKSLNDRILLNNGHLHYCFDKMDDELISDYAHNIVSFYTQHTESNGNFLFVVAPSQIYDAEKLLPDGYSDYSNESTDKFIHILQDNGVPVLDLRQEMVNQGINPDDAFYVTDHHWKTETEFWAYKEIMKKLHSMGVISELDEFYIDESNYNFDIYEKSFLGSSGKRTGKYYAGLDDFCLIHPKFDTNISVTLPFKDIEESGTYAEVSFTQPLDTLDSILKEKDLYRTSPYEFYSKGNPPLINWRNPSAKEDHKLLLIGDSFGNIPFSLMPLYFTACDELDTRQNDMDFPAYYNEYQPDTVVMLINTFGVSTSFVRHPYLNQ